MASPCTRKTNPPPQPPKAAAPSKTEFKPKYYRGGGNAFPAFFGVNAAPILRSSREWETIFLALYGTCLCTRDCALAEFPGCGNGSPATGPSRLRECRRASSGSARSSSRARAGGEVAGSGREAAVRACARGAGSSRERAGCAHQSADAGCGEDSAGEHGEGKDGRWFCERKQKTPQARRVS